jgi:hypothetical protein
LKPLTISIGIFLILVGMLTVAGFLILVEPGNGSRTQYVTTAAKLFLFRHGVIDELSPQETQTLYLSTCTRKCHSTDVIENKPRTAVEWEWVVDRMNTKDRADLSISEAGSITEYLQRNFLSNVPTFLPEQTMRFLKRHLWKSDFGEDDIYLDLIYIPTLHTALLPYLVAGRSVGGSEPTPGEHFVLYINTHQGIVPPWDLAELAILRDGNGHEQQATNWQVIYDDGQQHHRQGLLSFPPLNSDKIAAIEIEISLPHMRKRYFLWDLPVPDYIPQEEDHTDV